MMIIHNPKELAMFIKNYRQQLGLSQSDIGNQVGLKQTTVSAFERKPESTKLDTLFRILATSGLEIELKPKNTAGKKTSWQEEW
jgi:HTH-type transcriptional regulator / antitoxin HipB